MFVKKISLERDDDAAKKDEGKLWSENRRKKETEMNETLEDGGLGPKVKALEEVSSDVQTRGGNYKTS